MGAALPIIIASQAAEARRSLLERFRVSDATHPERARSLAALAITTSPALEELRRMGVVREGTQGTFYLDEVAAARVMNPRSARTVKVLIAVLVVLALVLMAGIVMLRAQ